MPSSSQVAAVSSRPSDWSDSVTLTQIDPALLILSLQLTLRGAVDTVQAVQSFDQVQTNFTAGTQGQVTVGRENGSPWLTTTPRDWVQDLLPAGPDLRSPGWEATLAPRFLIGHGEDTASATFQHVQGGTDDGGALIGTGSVTLPGRASARVTATGPGNMRAVFRTDIAAEVSTLAQTASPALTGAAPPGNSFTALITGATIELFGHPWSRTTPQLIRVGDDVTGTSSNVSVAPFDPHLGRMISAKVSITVDAVGTADIENLDLDPSSVTFSQSAGITLLGPGGNELAASTASLGPSTGGWLASAALGGFDGVDDFAGPSAQHFALIAPGTSRLEPLTLDALPTTLLAVRTGSSRIDGPGNMDLQSTLRSGATVAVTYSYDPNDVRATDLGSGISWADAAVAYAGPVAGLNRQYAWAGSDGAALAADSPNMFLKGGAGDDALEASSGDNVLDGGGGSNFLVGGTGHDTFYVDLRAPQAPTWNTIVGFHPGDAATIWGFEAGRSTVWQTAWDGAAGYQGLTLHTELNGDGTGVSSSLSFAGLTQSTADEHLVFTTGNVPGEPGFLLIQYI